MSPRTGRPKSNNPKLFEVKARIDESTNTMLNEYCKKNDTTRTCVVRQGIDLVLKNETKK